MYLLNLDNDMKVEGVSSNFKQLMLVTSQSLRNTFFLSMVDSDVPDQLADDMQASLSKGLTYNSVLKLNVLKHNRWFDVTISPRFSNGEKVGYLVKLTDVNGTILKSNYEIFSQVKKGILVLQNGFPVTKDMHLKLRYSKTNNWKKRIK